MTSRAQIAAEIAAEVEWWKQRALSHNGCIPAMWLDRGFIIRCHSWLDDRWGGGDWWRVVRIEPDQFRNYVRIHMRAKRNGIQMGWEAVRAEHDLIELLSPQICSPTQWRLRS